MHTTVYLADAILAAPLQAAPTSLHDVVTGIQGWIMGLLAAVATLFLVVGGLRYMTAGGDPAQIEQAKGNVKAAVIGYALAVLAPMILQILAGIVGGPTS
jgi:phosphotransferase system  glucose/maltose/N-acetylglucosamine-specific IIC component